MSRIPQNESTQRNSTPSLVGWKLENTYTSLPKEFYAPVTPSSLRSPSLVVLNQPLAQELGLDFSKVTEKETALLLSGNVLPEQADPIAQAYAGHQFGGFTMLGDGRAILLGEQVTPDGKRIDIQLKGQGPTPFSRRGDGRAALGPMLREYIISEAMNAFGIPTTRSLAVVRTGEPVYRESVLPGAVLTRTASSHIRVGTFEYIAARADRVGLQALADYSIRRHYPELNDKNELYLEFFRAVMHRQAALVARWQMVGFIHGVMNTDNVSISGETIDYGPCAFMNHYDPSTVFSSIDSQGRYAYGNQSTICHWNLVRFAESLLMLFDDAAERAVDIANQEIAKFPEIFHDYWLQGMRAKLGLSSTHKDDEGLIEELLQWMLEARVDFTNTFRDLSQVGLPKDAVYQQDRFIAWYHRWKERLTAEATSDEKRITLMKKTNPSVIPRNHLVEDALSAASERDDLTDLHALVQILSKPFDDLPFDSEYLQLPPANSCQYKTFCGT